MKIQACRSRLRQGCRRLQQSSIENSQAVYNVKNRLDGQKRIIRLEQTLFLITDAGDLRYTGKRHMYILRDGSMVWLRMLYSDLETVLGVL